MFTFLAGLVLCGLPIVAIDAGHGGLQEGALGICGLVEKDLTLSLAGQVTAILEQSGHVTPLMTHDQDVSLGLTERSEIANRAGAVLFLSIHGNASPNSSAHGVETYFLSNRAAGTRIAHLAARENDGEHFAVAAQNTALQRILNGLSLEAAHVESQRFALTVQAALSETLPNHGRGVLQAPFVVLVDAHMAAALVEVGFLSNPTECLLLSNTRYQAALAQSLASAILAHVASDPKPLAQQ